MARSARCLRQIPGYEATAPDNLAGLALSIKLSRGELEGNVVEKQAFWSIWSISTSNTTHRLHT